jgi:hypothetical protein
MEASTDIPPSEQLRSRRCGGSRAGSSGPGRSQTLNGEGGPSKEGFVRSRADKTSRVWKGRGRKGRRAKTAQWLAKENPKKAKLRRGTSGMRPKPPHPSRTGARMKALEASTRLWRIGQRCRSHAPTARGHGERRARAAVRQGKPLESESRTWQRGETNPRGRARSKPSRTCKTSRTERSGPWEARITARARAPCVDSLS